LSAIGVEPEDAMPGWVDDGRCTARAGLLADGRLTVEAERNAVIDELVDALGSFALGAASECLVALAVCLSGLA
jgi:hypothetical protein